MTNQKISSFGIVRITPQLLERGQLWFEQNKNRIHKQSLDPISWWSTNYIELEKDEVIPMSHLMRRLSDWGYQKVVTVRAPGEFANRGGVLDLFAINNKNATRIEYEGNKISSIGQLKEVLIANQEKKLKHLLSKPAHTPKNELLKKQQHQELLATLREGSYVVHIDHGIARFKGIEQSHEGEHLVLEYASGDMLYIPRDLRGRITPYIGFVDPTLTRLGGNLWERTKRKVKEDLLKTAEELVAIYAKRELAKRTPYVIDTSLTSAVGETFEYQETPDQIASLNSILHDLESTRPMDRIICGDVGFGKTEVALRAASYAVSAGYQVALVAPTTILAHQHANTFIKRFSKTSGFPVTIKKLTRIEKRPQQKEIILSLEKGTCDIVIGTHRLLQNDVAFRNLGLLIIDEEQRFGVKQKEFLKKKRVELDILSLSATPIPRTLSFALSGLRDINIIATPPPGRKPIQTLIHRFDRKIVKEALEKELARNGQVYWLHNRILSLGRVQEEIKKMVPSARVDFLHAKLPEEELIRKIDAFAEGKIDILVSTTIMENGLDLTNANTLIVDDATILGLAQAHQIRGRIGRSDRQAYAYFLYPAKKLAEKPRARLKALEDAQYLGAGYQIALRDLEIRGAGNFLGRAQSGNIRRVGFNLYCQLLNEAIEEIRNQP